MIFHWSLSDSKFPQVSRTLLSILAVLSNVVIWIISTRIIIIIIIIYSFRVFHWSLSDSKCPQVSRPRLSILVVLNNAVVWMISSRLATSKSSRPINNPLFTVPKAPITIGTIITIMFHSFFNSLARSRYLSFFSHSFSFILWSAETATSTILQIFFFFVDYYKIWSSGRD